MSVCVAESRKEKGQIERYKNGETGKSRYYAEEFVFKVSKYWNFVK